MQVKCCGSCIYCLPNNKSVTGFICDLSENNAESVKLFQNPCEKYEEYKKSHESIIASFLCL